MVALRPNLGNANNWEYVYEDTFFAGVIPSTPPSYNPIPAQVCPIQLDRFTVAIYANTQDPKPRWKYAGLVSAQVVTGLFTGGNSQSVIAQFPIFLNRVNVLRFPELSDSLSLKIEIPVWFKAFFYTLWKYTGPGAPDLEGKADAIYQELQSGV